jgi:hypothetical protein
VNDFDQSTHDAQSAAFLVSVWADFDLLIVKAIDAI